jgi:hypothetical protein
MPEGSSVFDCPFADSERKKSRRRSAVIDGVALLIRNNSDG